MNINKLVELGVVLVEGVLGVDGEIEPEALVMRMGEGGELEMGVISVGELMGQGEAGKDQVAEGLRRVAGMQGVVAIVMVSDTGHWNLEGADWKGAGYASLEELGRAFAGMGLEERLGVCERLEAVHVSIDSKWGRASIAQTYRRVGRMRLAVGEVMVMIDGVGGAEIKGRLASFFEPGN